MSPYTQTSWADLQTRAFDRLGDTLFYSNVDPYPEVTLYLKEALRCWNSMALFWRERLTLPTVPGQAWYNLNSQALFTQSLLDSDLIAEIQYHLLEPVDPTIWTGTDMFNLDQITKTVQRRRDQFLLETAIQLTHDLINLPIPTEGRIVLDEDVVDVRRLEWVTTTGMRRILWRDDEWAANAFTSGWRMAAAAIPSTFSVILTPPLSIQLIPYPSLSGQLDLLTVNSGAILNPLAGVLLGIPDDYAWAIKYGAMADLLGAEGMARDTSRASYCEQRYQQGAELARIMPIVLEAQINGITVPVLSVTDMDSFRPSWPNSSGRPVMLAVFHHWVVPYPVPDGVYSITLDVIRPAPIPALGTDFLNLGPEQLDSIMDYTQHIAAFKQGGMEFSVTQQKFEDFIRLAGVHNQRLNASSVFRSPQQTLSPREQHDRPYRDEEAYAS